MFTQRISPAMARLQRKSDWFDKILILFENIFQEHMNGLTAIGFRDIIISIRKRGCLIGIKTATM